MTLRSRKETKSIYETPKWQCCFTVKNNRRMPVLLLLLIIVEGPNQFNEKNEALERKKQNVFAYEMMDNLKSPSESTNLLLEVMRELMAGYKIKRSTCKPQ